MNISIILLILAYFILPAAILSKTLRRIRETKGDSKSHLGAWLVHNLATLLIGFSFLPLLFWPEINLHITPVGGLSIIYFVASLLIAAILVEPARKRERLFFYTGGVKSAFFEEVLFRGVIFGLTQLLTNNLWVVVIINSLLFGLWHLKNISWSGPKKAIPQAFYTGLVAGPIFNLLLVFSGDIYLSILAHLLHNAVLTFTKKGKV